MMKYFIKLVVVFAMILALSTANVQSAQASITDSEVIVQRGAGGSGDAWINTGMYVKKGTAQPPNMISDPPDQNLAPSGELRYIFDKEQPIVQDFILNISAKELPPNYPRSLVCAAYKAKVTLNGEVEEGAWLVEPPQGSGIILLHNPETIEIPPSIDAACGS